MTDDEKREAYLEWINNETNRDYSIDDLPMLVELILDKLMEMDGEINVKSKSQGGRSITFTDGLPDKLNQLIHSIRKVKWE